MREKKKEGRRRGMGEKENKEIVILCSLLLLLSNLAILLCFSKHCYFGIHQKIC